MIASHDLAIQFNHFFPYTDRQNELAIKHVKTDGPAERAGLLPGDRFLSLNGEDVQKASQVLAICGM